MGKFTDQDALEKAEQLFWKFHDRAPKENEIFEIELDGSIEVLVLGKLDGIMYSVDWEDKPFFHRFKKSDRPLLVVSSDGKQAFILRGGYKVTERGFIG